MKKNNVIKQWKVTAVDADSKTKRKHSCFIKNVLRISMGRSGKMPRQDNIFKSYCYLSSIYNSKLEILFERMLVSSENFKNYPVLNGGLYVGMSFVSFNL